MKAEEHRALGDAASAGATVNVGGDTPESRLSLRFGDVVALSGDYFVPDDSPVLEAGGSARDSIGGAGEWTHEVLASGGLFWLARVPGRQGTRPGSRDELTAALQVMALDQKVRDPRFEPGGELEGQRADVIVERRVRDRFLALGASNDDHFVAPGARGVATVHDRAAPRFGSATSAYRVLHEQALRRAWRLGRDGGDVERAMAREAAAQHYLTDAFAAGHLRTPVAAIRELWQVRHPGFWEGLQRKVASDVSEALRQLVAPIRALPRAYVHSRSLAVVAARTRGFPRVSLGDLLAKVFHDWDNRQGLVLEGGEMIFGDGCLGQGVTRHAALAAARAGIDEVEIAYGLGRSGRSVGAEALYAAVRELGGAPGDRFRPEVWIPRPSPENPPQNWRAADVEELWDSPIVGHRGTTVGDAVTDALQAGEDLPSRLDCLGRGIFGELGVASLPLLRGWLSRKVCQAYHRGFVESLMADPRGCVLQVLAGGALEPERERLTPSPAGWRWLEAPVPAPRGEFSTLGP